MRDARSSVAIPTTRDSETLLEEFTDYQHGRGLSTKTIKRRRDTLRMFTRDAGDDLRGCSPDFIEGWVARRGSQATKRAYRSDLMMFYRWANRRRGFTSNPVTETDPVRVPRRLPRPVASEQVRRILEEAPTDSLRLMIALAAYAGLRCAEIASIEWDQIDVDAGEVVIRDGKGGKDRRVPMHPDLAGVVGRRNRGVGRVFELMPDTVGKQIATHLRSLGINASAHKLRHTFGTEAARATNGNVVLVAYLMGHASVSTTMGYIGWSGGEAANAIHSMFPAGSNV